MDLHSIELRTYNIFRQDKIAIDTKSCEYILEYIKENYLTEFQDEDINPNIYGEWYDFSYTGIVIDIVKNGKYTDNILEMQTESKRIVKKIMRDINQIINCELIADLYSNYQDRYVIIFKSKKEIKTYEGFIFNR